MATNIDSFKQEITQGYSFTGDFITLGTAIINGEGIPETLVNIPLKTLNRHGLIAGATGTGKTKTLQVLSEQLSSKGIPSLLMDLKGDLSGLARPGSMNEHIEKRHSLIGIPYHPESMPVELLTISNEKGARLRATVSEFGPVLFSKILELNETQSGMVSIIFKYCDDNKLPLLDLQDFKTTLNYITNEGKEIVEREYGKISGVSVSTILRKVIELEQQGADLFFGEESFDVEDLLRTDEKGNGYISIIRLTDIQNKPKLFSTFMLCLLAEIYNTFPEMGDPSKPKLALFIDEAHLIFKEASRELLSQLEAIIKLIRSKGVGVFFCTQNPDDIPDVILSQLGLKVQHALRAFTAKDRKNIKKASENYPISDYYKTDEIITSLGIGEALITALDEKGRPTPLVATLLSAPKTRMDILSPSEINDITNRSELIEVYNKEIDRESAYEILTKKIQQAQEAERQEILKKQQEDIRETHEKSRPRRSQPSAVEKISKNTMVRQLGRTVTKEIARGLLGILGVAVSSGRRRRR